MTIFDLWLESVYVAGLLQLHSDFWLCGGPTPLTRLCCPRVNCVSPVSSIWCLETRKKINQQLADSEAFASKTQLQNQQS